MTASGDPIRVVVVDDDADSEVKIVVFSARYDKYDANDLLSNRADLYIDKTRTIPELLEEVALLVAADAT